MSDGQSTSEPVVLPTTIIRVHGLECPDCGKQRLVFMEYQAYVKLMEGVSPSEAIPNHNRDDWEAFISGMCPKCWEKLKGPDD